MSDATDLLFVLVTLVAAVVPIWILLEHPVWLLYGLVVYLPFEEFVEKWLVGTPLFLVSRYGGELLIFAALGHVILQKIVRGIPWRRSPLDLALGGFLLAAGLSMIVNNVSVVASGLGLRIIIRYVAIVYIVANIEITTVAFERIMKGLVTVSTVVCCIALIQSIVGASATRFLLPGDVELAGQVLKEGVRGYVGERTRVFATMGRYDTLGTFLVVVLLMSAGLYYRLPEPMRRRVRWLWVVAVPALALSYSRQSWVAIFIGLMVIAIIDRRPRLAAALVIGPPLIVVAVALLFPSAIEYSSYTADVGIVNRLLEPFSAEYIRVSRERFGRLGVLIDVGARILGRALWLGFGPGAFGSLTARFLGVNSGALVDVPEDSAYLINDVNWITILGQFGLIGATCFLWMLLALARTARTVAADRRPGLLGGLGTGYVALTAAFIFLGFLGPNFEVRQVSFYYWMFGGMLLGLRERMPQSPPRTGGRSRPPDGSTHHSLA